MQGSTLRRFEVIEGGGPVTIRRVDRITRQRLRREVVAEIYAAVKGSEPKIRRLADAGDDLGLLYETYLEQLEERARRLGVAPVRHGRRGPRWS